jgi:hypothetical protein
MGASVLMSTADAKTAGPVSLAWQRFEIPEFGTSVDYPAGIFASSGPSKKGLGRQFDSPDGRTVLSIYSQENTNADTPASYLRNNLRVGQRALDYERVTRSFFAVSMERGGLSITAVAIFQVPRPPQFIASIWFTRRRRRRRGTPS